MMQNKRYYISLSTTQGLDINLKSNRGSSSLFQYHEV